MRQSNKVAASHNQIASNVNSALEHSACKSVTWDRLSAGGGGGVLIYFFVRERAAEQGINFRIPTPGRGIIFAKIGSMTGSIFVIFDSERSF